MSDWEKSDFSYYGQGLDLSDDKIKGPSHFESYTDFVKAQVEGIPEHLLVLLPYTEGDYVFKKIQLEWICDFWDSRKKLES
jgi:hypothetical protein